MCKFWPRKLRSCKCLDKYHVCWEIQQTVRKCVQVYKIMSDLDPLLPFLLHLAKSRETCVDCTHELYYRPPGFSFLRKWSWCNPIFHILHPFILFPVVLKSNIALDSFQTWDVFVVYLGVLVLQLASVVNDNFLGTFLSVRSVRVGSRVTLSEALVKWVRCVPMHCNVMPRGLLLSMILRAISWGIYQVEPPPYFPSRYEWVIFKILRFLLVNPDFLTAWLSSVCILDRLLIGGEQKPIPKYQQHCQTCFFF